MNVTLTVLEKITYFKNSLGMFFFVKISIEDCKVKINSFVSISHLEKTSQEGMYSLLATRQRLFSILVLLDKNFYVLQKIALLCKP